MGYNRGIIQERVGFAVQHQVVERQQPLIEAAESFVRTCYKELNLSDADIEARIQEIKLAISKTGTYEHTHEELTHGAKMAWRNSNRCIGRLFWESLHVMDARAAVTEEEMAEALVKHIDFATNGGKIRPAITVFRAQSPSRPDGPRIWNYQLVRYAGYETKDGITGDPDSVRFTAVCRQLGWEGAGTAFDVLPLVLQSRPEREPQWFNIDPGKVLEVPIRHPEYERFAELGLRWYAVPLVSNMVLEIGGLRYTAAPFNGWYMGTEIGARNFADDYRYNQLPKVADIVGLDTSRDSSLWRDRALVELNIAVLHSFRLAGVTIVDHHTAARQFASFEERERRMQRETTGDWTWLIPPVSPATTHIFHRSYPNRMESPNYFYQDDPY